MQGPIDGRMTADANHVQTAKRLKLSLAGVQTLTSKDLEMHHSPGTLRCFGWGAPPCAPNWTSKILATSFIFPSGAACACLISFPCLESPDPCLLASASRITSYERVLLQTSTVDPLLKVRRSALMWLLFLWDFQTTLGIKKAMQQELLSFWNTGRKTESQAAKIAQAMPSKTSATSKRMKSSSCSIRWRRRRQNCVVFPPQKWSRVKALLGLMVEAYRAPCLTALYSLFFVAVRHYPSTCTAGRAAGGPKCWSRKKASVNQRPSESLLLVSSPLLPAYDPCCCSTASRPCFTWRLAVSVCFCSWFASSASSEANQLCSET